MNNLFDVSNEIVLITGAAGNLGIEYCNLFLNNRAKVIGLDIVSNKSVCNLAIENPNNFTFIETDITLSSNYSRILGSINAFGIPTVIINNAAIDSPPNAPLEETGPFEDFPESSWDEVLKVNLKGVFLICKYIGGLMSKSKGGSIINISSIYGVVSPDQSIYNYRRERGETFYKPIAYSASKSGLLNMTRYLSVYWAKKNIRVNTLVISGVFNNQEKEFINAYNNRIPIGRMANKDEYNGALIFLASNASKYMTGSTLTIDGGWTAI
jgi:NAD(P)-dependent dehydrogenase (short-subunit alcohol dehydrogenase family)